MQGAAVCGHQLVVVLCQVDMLYFIVLPVCQDLKLVLRLADATEDFAAAATFTKVPGLSDPTDTSLLSFIWKNGTQQMYMAQAPKYVPRNLFVWSCAWKYQFWWVYSEDKRNKFIWNASWIL